MGITRCIICKNDIHENLNFQNFGKLSKTGYFAIFSKKVLISETVRDRAKRTKVRDHKVHNMLERHTLKFYNFSKFWEIIQNWLFGLFFEKVLISETVRESGKWTKILDHKGIVCNTYQLLKFF